jgi:hypothetical protein
MWLLKPPKPPKIRKNTVCHICKEKHAVITDEWFLHGLPMCAECNEQMRIVDYNISRFMGDFDWMEDYNKLITHKEKFK